MTQVYKRMGDFFKMRRVGMNDDTRIRVGVLMPDTMWGPECMYLGNKNYYRTTVSHVDESKIKETIMCDIPYLQFISSACTMNHDAAVEMLKKNSPGGWRYCVYDVPPDVDPDMGLDGPI